MSLIHKGPSRTLSQGSLLWWWGQGLPRVCLRQHKTHIEGKLKCFHLYSLYAFTLCRAAMPFGGPMTSKRVIPVINYEQVDPQNLPGSVVDRMTQRPNFNRAPRGWGMDYNPESADLWRTWQKSQYANYPPGGACPGRETEIWLITCACIFSLLATYMLYVYEWEDTGLCAINSDGPDSIELRSRSGGEGVLNSLVTTPVNSVQNHRNHRPSC